MNRWILFFVIVAAMSAAPALACAQAPDNAPPSTLNFESGVIANGVYSNECFGFSLPIPSGWKVDESISVDGKARHRYDKGLLLLVLHKQGDPAGRIFLTASAAGDQSSSAQDSVSTAVHEEVKLSSDLELVRDASAVDYGGVHFYRFDYQHLQSGQTAGYSAYVYTKFRGYIIGDTISSGSLQGLDEAASSLHAITFQQDQINPKCVMALDKPLRVRASQGVSQSLLVKRVPPAYPDSARQARIQGQVILHAIIDTGGNVSELSLASGHPMLAPAAITAVKQWKYRPYLMNNHPAEVETQIIVNFTLSEQ
jgi:TonB family protein